MQNSPEFKALNTHYNTLSKISLAQLFAQDPIRFKNFSIKTGSLLLDYSKNHITKETLEQLIALAKMRQLPEQIVDLFSGKAVNNSENRPALHTALREPDDQSSCVDDASIPLLVHQTLKKMSKWVSQLRQGKWLGSTQKPIDTIVHIGIGGSHLGPMMVSEALASYDDSPLRYYFASCVDSAELEDFIYTLNPDTTLFIIASKTFATQETRLIADKAKAWLSQRWRFENISPHFAAITADAKNAEDYGIHPDRILPIWDWVGGRYSIWSTMGLPIALKMGMPNFRKFLAGAHAMDEHFRITSFNSNMPVILGLIDFWYVQFFKTTTQAVLPYDYRLRSFTRYLQQLEMESNGKCVHKNGQPVEGLTAPILFGEMGTNGQHSFHQLLFQGTHLIPCDFIGVLTSDEPDDRPILLSHCLAQSRGRMLGKSASDIQHELLEKGYDLDLATKLALHKAIPGNQPSNTILIPELTPFNLGALMALYEHRTFVQGVLWDINSFDQWGVELGKEMAKDLLPCLLEKKNEGNYDGSTLGLMEYYWGLTAKLS